MSEFRVPVVKIDKIGKHPNADRLEITTVEGCPCIFQTGQFKTGDSAVYIPVDAVVTQGISGLEFLKYTTLGKCRIKALRLRGIFSMGVLLSADPTWEPGQDVAAILGITKFEEAEDLGMNTENESDPGFMPVYDMENFRKYGGHFSEGEIVSVTEKIHGCNSRMTFRDGRLWVGSHRQVKRPDDTNLWWDVAKRYDLEAKLSTVPGIVLYGETYGAVQDLKYGTKPGERLFRAFDAFDSTDGKWLSAEPFFALCQKLDIPTVPVLYFGPFTDAKVRELAAGKSTLADHMREGVVIRPVVERYVEHFGRLILKLISEEYLLRKNGTERH